MNNKLKLICVLLLIAVFALPCFTYGGPINLKLGTILSVNDPVHKGCEKFADLVSKRSNGKLTVTIYPAGQMGAAPAQIDAVKMGALDIFVEGVGWYETYTKDISVYALLGIYRDQAHLMKVLNGPIGKKTFSDLERDHGLKTIAYNWYRPPRQVVSKRPITTLGDLKGLKIRVPELKNWIAAWKGVGASPTPVAWAETYTALQQGIVDAMEGPIPLVFSAKFYEVCKYITLTDHLRHVTTVVINSKRFDSLPEDLQKIVAEAAVEAGEYQNILMTKAENDDLKAMEDSGCKVLQMANPERFMTRLDETNYALEDSGAWSKGLVDEIKNTR